jgi:hypothetical protein
VEKGEVPRNSECEWKVHFLPKEDSVNSVFIYVE